MKTQKTGRKHTAHTVQTRLVPKLRHCSSAIARKSRLGEVRCDLVPVGMRAVAIETDLKGEAGTEGAPARAAHNGKGAVIGR